MIHNQIATAGKRSPHGATGPSAHSANAGVSVRAEMVSIPDTMKVLGLRSRTSIYELAKQGALDMRKLLGRSLVTQASIDRLVADAPRASASPEKSAA